MSRLEGRVSGPGARRSASTQGADSAVAVDPRQLDMFAEVAPVTAPAGPAGVFERNRAVDAIPVERAGPTQLQSSQGSEDRMADAGEELVANRRNRGRQALTWQDLASLNDALKVKEAVKGNIWPKPDYQALIDGGMQPLIAHVVKQVYDSVAAKPASALDGLVGDAQLQAYLTGVQRVERGLMSWVDDKAALKAWTEKNMAALGGGMGLRVALTDLLPASSLLERVYPDGWRNHRQELRLAGGNKLLGALQPGYDEIQRACKAIDAGWPGKREAWEVQGFKVLERPDIRIASIPAGGKFSVAVAKYHIGIHPTEAEAQEAAAGIKPFVLVGKRGFVDSFMSGEEAVEAAKERARATKGGVGLTFDERGFNVALAERVGPVRRMADEDISAERLMQEFGLRGVNFGNWMKTPSARAEAQLHLNHAHDALHDLADLLGVPPKALSLGGMLGLAFGAQGHGGRNAAHFVPGVNEINLTRAAGAGALAHEWAHAVDHYFARGAGIEAADEPYLSAHAELGAMKKRHELVDGKFVPVESPRFGAIRPEIVAAFKAVSVAMTKRLQTPEEVRTQDARALERVEKNVQGWLASIRRDFTGLEDEFDVLANRVRAGDLGTEKVAAGPNTYLSEPVGAMRDLYKAKHGRLYSLDQLKGLQSNVDSLAYRRQKAEHDAAMSADSAQAPEARSVSTDYAINAAQLDKDKGGKPYWSTKCELFARAFDSFIADKLAAREAKNTYLSFGVRENETVPIGRERQAINSAFDTLVGEFAVRETALGPALFSATGERGAQSGCSPTEIYSEVWRLRKRWPGMPEVHVVREVSDLPFNAPSNADGAYHDGKVYVVANNIADKRQLLKVMAHECVMHHSLEEMLGHYGFAKLHHGVQALKAAGDETVCSIAADVKSRYGDLPPDIETKEIVARAGEQCLDEQGNLRVRFGFMKGVFAGVASWIRDHGISVPFTNVELQGILHNSGEWAKNAPAVGTAVRTKPMHERVAARLGGLFVGKIVAMGDRAVTQRVGRDGETVDHLISDLSRPLQLGELAEITYRDGKGVVNRPGRDQDHGIGQ